jgi:hypothetical protein
LKHSGDSQPDGRHLVSPTGVLFQEPTFELGLSRFHPAARSLLSPF